MSVELQTASHIKSDAQFEVHMHFGGRNWRYDCWRMRE